MNSSGLSLSRQGESISLIFPVYNAAARIDEIWDRVRAFLRVHPNWDAIFVCDGCTDSTESRLRSLTVASGMRVRVLSYPQNRGKGYAVRLGMLSASGTWRIFTDVDLAYDFTDVEGLAQRLQTGNDVVIASRNHPDSEMILPCRMLPYIMRRHIQSRIFGWVVRMLLPLSQLDTQAGLKGMTAQSAETILPHLRCNGFGFDCELLTACCRFSIPVTEMPVVVRYDADASTTGWRTIRKMLSEIFAIRRDWKRGIPAVQPMPIVTLPDSRAA